MARPTPNRKKRIINPPNIKLNFTAILLVAFVVFLCATSVTFVYAISRNTHKKDTVSAAVDQKSLEPVVAEPQFDGQIKNTAAGIGSTS